MTSDKLLTAGSTNTTRQVALASEESMRRLSSSASCKMSESVVRIPVGTVQQTADVCRQFLNALRTLDAHQENYPTHRDEATTTESIPVDSNDRLQIEVETLKRQLRELVNMNVCWQQRSKEQDRQIAEFREKLELAETKLMNSTPVEQPAGKTVERKQQCTCLQKLNATLETENVQLKSELEISNGLVRQLELQTSHLEAALKEKDSSIETLQIQIMIYREDFECERRDRERAQSDLAEVKTQLDLLQRHPIERSVYSQHGLTARGFTHETAPRYGNRTYNGDEQRSRFYGLDETDGVLEEDTINSTTVQTMSPSQHESSHDSAILQCPNCRRIFSKDEHIELMDHLEECSN